MNHRRRTLLATAVAAPVCMSALAQPRRSFSALSLVGNELTIYTLQGTTGSHLDSSEREKLVMPNFTIDEAALKTMEKVLQGAGDPQPFLLVPGGKAFYEGAAAMVDGERFVPNSALRPAIEQLKEAVTHLVLLTRTRGTGGLRGARLPNGPRSVDGLGFCLDASWREKEGNTVIVSSGLMAPFVSVRASLVELKSGRVVRSEAINASGLLPTPPGHTNPWDALSNEAKMGALSELLSKELQRVLPALLSA